MSYFGDFNLKNLDWEYPFMNDERPFMVHILTGILLRIFDGSKDSGVQKSQTTDRIHIHHHIITSVAQIMLPTVENL